jgi:flagellar biosynthesis component FlhA
MRVFWGIVVQPFVVGGLAFISFPALLLDRGGRTLAGGFPADVIDAARSVAIGAGLVALVVALLGALPTAVWLTKRRPVSLGEALLFGLVFGNIPFELGTILAGSYGVPGFVRGMAFSSLLGLAGAAAFWAIALRGQSVSRPPDAG